MGLDPEEDSLVRLLLRAATLGGVVALVITGSSSVLAEGDGGGASHRADDGTLTQVASAIGLIFLRRQRGQRDS